MLTSAEIRQLFFDYFKSKSHKIVASAPIVLKNDPTLMFTNAGMNQFKEYFLGNKVSVDSKIANSQKCLRVSGKHNDLEEVGKDTYHHTMFEMLGNWSFGDYFKKEAIKYSWELLTEIYKIPIDRIYVSIFKGDEKEKLNEDIESKNIWLKYINEDRILAFNKKDNFWEMGETGPCGPCSEIHIDCRDDIEREKIDGKNLINKDHPLVIEIWNNVFIQYNRLKDGSLKELPQKHVDTGMGLERLVRVIQNKKSNYDTDLFSIIFKKIEEITNEKYSGTDTYKDIAFRVVADHIRAVCFTICDGQLPSNTGSGYVIRRILRRSIRYYYTHLNYHNALLHKLVIIIAEQFKNVFPELYNQKEFVEKIILEEENNFLKTISSGIKRLENYLQKNINKEISGKIAFELLDTYGFPIDLTNTIALEKNLTVNNNEFEQLMLEQKDRSREATKTDFGDWVYLNNEKKENSFVGYNKFDVNTKLLQYREIFEKGKTLYQWVLLETPFYAESGGQCGDTGVLIFNNEAINVIDTKNENNLIVHITQTKPKEITNNVIAKIDLKKRLEISKHHSATHLLHSALKQHLGNHVNQKGAYLCDEYLRFDFSHFEKINENDLIKIEEIINEKINQNINVETFIIPKEEAIKKGANALFGEKYKDMVRMVVIDKNFSLELCGGTHIENTSSIGEFKIIQETSVAAGVRRIEAVCGLTYKKIIKNNLEELNLIKKLFNNPKNIINNLENIILEKKTIIKQYENIEDKYVNLYVENILSTQIYNNSITTIYKETDIKNINILKKISNNLKNKLLSNYIICLTSIIENNLNIILSIDENYANVKNIDLNQFAKTHLLEVIKGKGGGQKTNITLIGSNINTSKEIFKTIDLNLK